MIFADNAPRYWSVGLPVIPLHKWDDMGLNGKSLGKAPCVEAWQRFHEKMPTQEEMTNWLKKFPDVNIGLPLGQQSRCVALDIDSEIEAEISLIEKLVPTSPWVRVGKHGKVLMFGYNGEQTFRIKDMTGRTICELLSSRTQVVLPPSVHPSTKKPYTANCNLYDVVDSLPILPKDIETILRQNLADSGVELGTEGWTRTTDWVSAGSRDVKMTAVAGMYAMAAIRGEVTLLEAIDMLRAWVATRTEKVAGDNIDVEKGVKNLVKFFVKDIVGPKKRVLPKGWDTGLTEEQIKSWGLNFNEENISWDFSRLNSYLKEQLSNTELTGEKRSEIVDYALQRISQSNMTDIEEEQCLQYISHTSNLISLGALRKRLRSLKQDGISGNDQTEIAIEVLRDLDEKIPNYESNPNDEDRFPSLRFTNGSFWSWGGSHWEVMPDSVIEKHIATEYGSLPAAKRASDHKGIMHIMSTLVLENLSGADIKGVNFANGFVDMFGKLHPHSRKFGATYTLPYSYKPNDKIPPKFAAFLKQVWGEDRDYEQKVRTLQQVMASTMFGLAPSFSRAILLYGIGGSGKSQLLTIVRKMLPQDIVSLVSPYNFTDKFMVTELSKSVLNICGELKENQPLTGDIFKQVIDGSPMQGQFKGKQIFNFTPKAAHWFASNYLPISQDTSAGFNRRWVILGFEHPVPADKKVRDLGDIIVAEEREQIASWCISIMAELHSMSDYQLPDSHIEYVTRMASENDSLFFFLTAQNIEGGGARLKKNVITPFSEIYSKYRNFCYSKAGAKPLGTRRFMSRMTELVKLLKLKIDSTGTKIEGLSLEEGDPIDRYII